MVQFSVAFGFFRGKILHELPIFLNRFNGRHFCTTSTNKMVFEYMRDLFFYFELWTQARHYSVNGANSVVANMISKFKGEKLSSNTLRAQFDPYGSHTLGTRSTDSNVAISDTVFDHECNGASVLIANCMRYTYFYRQFDAKHSFLKTLLMLHVFE